MEDAVVKPFMHLDEGGLRKMFRAENTVDYYDRETSKEGQ